MLDLAAEARLQDLRQRVLAGGHITAAEYRLIIDDIRRDRETAVVTKPRNKKVASAVTGTDLMGLFTAKKE